MEIEHAVAAGTTGRLEVLRSGDRVTIAIVTPLEFVLGLAAGVVALVLLGIVLSQRLGMASGRGRRRAGWSMETALWVGAGAVILLAIVVAMLFTAR